MKIALLIIDMQQEFIETEKLRDSLNDALEYINECSILFRKNNLPVIIIQDTEAGEGPNSQGFENINELIVDNHDKVIHKKFSNAFWQTELDNQLKALEVEFVVVSGFAAEYCVLFTLNGAFERGYGASLLQHGIAGVDSEMVQQTQLIRPTISLEALEFMLKSDS